MEPSTIAGLVVISILVAGAIWGLVWAVKFGNDLKKTQRNITDAALLRLIDKQPGGMVSVQQLAEQTGLTKNQVRSRLSALHMYGILAKGHSDGLRYYYGLATPIEEREIPELSPEPFLTADDILKLFQVYDFRLDAQQLILATGLPLKVIKREMKYFEKEGIIKKVNMPVRYGAPSQRVYLLEEPYRSDPKRFLSREKEMNTKVRELLRDELIL